MVWVQHRLEGSRSVLMISVIEFVIGKDHSVDQMENFVGFGAIEASYNC